MIVGDIAYRFDCTKADLTINDVARIFNVDESMYGADNKYINVHKMNVAFDLADDKMKIIGIKIKPSWFKADDKMKIEELKVFQQLLNDNNIFFNIYFTDFSNDKDVVTIKYILLNNDGVFVETKTVNSDCNYVKQ